MQWCPRNASNGGFQPLHVSANRADRLRSCEIVRRKTICFGRKGFGCICVPNWEGKTEIPVHIRGLRE